MNFQRCVVTDYGIVAISQKTEKAYRECFGKKRDRKYTKKSLSRAEFEMARDINAISRICWLLGKDGIPRGLV